MLFAASTLATHFEGLAYTQDLWGIGATLLALLVYLWIGSWSRTRVVISEAGLTVVNPLRRHQLVWSDVRGFGWGAWRVVHAATPREVSWSQEAELKWDRWYGLGVMPKMCAVLQDGSVVPMFGLMVGGGGLSQPAEQNLQTLQWALRRAQEGKTG